MAAPQFVLPEGAAFHNGSTLPLADDGEAEARLQRLATAISEGRRDEAVGVIRWLRSDRRDPLVPFGPRTSVPALERGVGMIAASGDELLLAALERDVSEQVQRARRERDLEALLDLATRGRVLAASREAAGLAARMLFEQGHWWIAAALARRSGLTELAAQAGARAGSEPLPEASPDSWTSRVIVKHRLDGDPDAPLPVVIDGRPGEVLLVDANGLFGFDPKRKEPTLDDMLWDEHVMRRLKEQRYVAVAPAPRGYAAARAGDRLVLPFNVSLDLNHGRAPWIKRSAWMLGLDLLAPAPDAIGLSAEGAGDVSVAWRARPEPSLTSSAFGPPLIRGERVFAQVFRTDDETEVSLVCLHLGTGELLWETPLVRGAFVPRYASRQAELNVSRLDKRAREGSLAEADGVVHVCTGFGVVAAVDAWTGAVRHTFRYDRLFPVDMGSYDPAFLFDLPPYGWDHEPVRIWRGRVVVAPSDSRYLYVLASAPGARGHVILDAPIEKMDRRQVVALLPDPDGGASPAVLASIFRDGRSGLVLLSPGGHVLERSPRLSRELSDLVGLGPGNRRPLLVGQRVLMPGRRGVAVFDVTDLAAAPRPMSAGPVLDAPVTELRRVAGGVVSLTPVLVDELVLVQIWADVP